jgi:hypothetical protein
MNPLHQPWLKNGGLIQGGDRLSQNRKRYDVSQLRYSSE